MTGKIGQRFLVFALFFAAVLPFHSASAQDAIGSITYRYGQYDGSGGATGYSGPLGSYGRSRFDEVNQRKNEAYRYGKIKELRQYRSRIERQIVDREKKRLSLQQDSSELNRIIKTVHQNLEKSYPEPGPELLDHEARRTINPVPLGRSEDQLQKRLDPVWNQIAKSSPFATAGALDSLNQKMLSIPGVDSSAIPSDEASFLRKELQISDVVNGQGILKAPFATSPSDPLYTSVDSLNGHFIRKGINQLVASESAIGAACVAASAPRDLCLKAQQTLNDEVAAFYALDRMAEMQGGSLDPASNSFFEGLLASARFSAGVAEGLFDGTVDLVEGLTQIVTHPIEVVRGLAHAITHAPQTYQIIKSALLSKLSELSDGDAGTRGRVLGEAVITIGSFFVGPGELSAVTEASGLVRAGIFESLATVSARTTEIARALSPFEIETCFLAGQMSIKAEDLGRFNAWAESVLNVGDNGDLANAIAVNLSKERFDEVLKIQTSLGADVSMKAQSYVWHRAAYERLIQKGGEFSEQDFVSMAKTYDRIEANMADVSGKAAPSAGFEAVRISYEKYSDSFGFVRETTDKSAFEGHEWNRFSSHRYSGPGEQMVYTSTGNKALETAWKEFGAGKPKGSARPYIYDSRLHPQKILDLTDESAREELGVSLSDLTSESYIKTQIVGALAKERGFDAILAPSAPLEGGENLILLKPIGEYVWKKN